MGRNVKRAGRTRIVGILAALYSLGIIVTLIASTPAGARRWIERDAPRGVVLAAAHDAIESHPFGELMVPYEYNRLRHRVMAPRDSDEESQRLADTVHVYFIVLGEMTWLLIALLAVGLIAALLAVFPGPARTIWAGVLMLLVAPAPIASVGPGSVLLTAPLLVFGILVLALRPRVVRPEPAAVTPGAGAAGATGEAPAATPIAGPATTNAGWEIATGVGLIVLGIGTAALAANMRGSRVAKVWIGAAAALGMGLWLLISGLVHLGRKRED